MFSITKEFHFSAAHVLTGLALGHQCGRMHGHNYIVKVELTAHNLNEQAFVQDYGELEPIKKYIDEKLDHKFIAESVSQAESYNLGGDQRYILLCQSSAENLAKHIFNVFKDQFPLISAIGISETPKTWAWYNKDIPWVKVVQPNTISGTISIDWGELEARVLKRLKENE